MGTKSRQPVFENRMQEAKPEGRHGDSEVWFAPEEARAMIKLNYLLIKYLYVT